MPQTCSAAGCKSRKDKDCRKSFYRIPVDPHQRENWIAAINRKNWTPTQYSRICSDHFVLGHPSRDPNHADYAPSIFPESKKNNNSHSKTTSRKSTVLTPVNTASEQTKGHLTHKRPPVRSSITSTTTKQTERYPSEVDAAEALLHMRKRPRVVKEECTLAQEEEGERVCVSVQPSSCHLALVQAENHLLREEIGRLQVQRSELEKQKRNLEVEKVSLRAQNKQLVAENTLLVRSLQESEDMVKRLNNEMFLLRFGTEIVSSQLEVASER